MIRFAPTASALLLLTSVVVAIGNPRASDPERLQWQPFGALSAPRAYASAVGLPTGEILVFGGIDRETERVANYTSELFDPETGRTRVLDHALPGRVQPSVAVTKDGRVVVAGGSEWRGDHWDVVDRVDVYLVYERRWVRVSPLLHGRTGQVGTALADGRVLVTGGYDGPRLIASTEVYDPRTDRWQYAAPMPSIRGDFAITTLPDGRVLVAGGLEGRNSEPTFTSLYYDPAADRWTEGPELRAERVLQTQVRMPNGDLFIVGGQRSASGSAERYDARAGKFAYAGTLVVPRMGAEAAALPDGRVVVTGGLPVYPGERQRFDPTERTEIWDPALNLWSEVAPVTSGRAFARLLQTAFGLYQVSGAAGDDTAEARIERFVWR